MTQVSGYSVSTFIICIFTYPCIRAGASINRVKVYDGKFDGKFLSLTVCHTAHQPCQFIGHAVHDVTDTGHRSLDLYYYYTSPVFV